MKITSGSFDFLGCWVVTYKSSRRSGPWTISAADVRSGYFSQYRRMPFISPNCTKRLDVILYWIVLALTFCNCVYLVSISANLCAGSSASTVNFSDFAENSQYSWYTAENEGGRAGSTGDEWLKAYMHTCILFATKAMHLCCRAWSLYRFRILGVTM